MLDNANVGVCATEYYFTLVCSYTYIHVVHMMVVPYILMFEAASEIDMHAASITSPFICMYNACAHTYNRVNPLPCDRILKAAFIGMSWLKNW